MNLTIQDLTNIYPALIIAIKSPNTTPNDMRVWLDLADKLESLIKEGANK